MAHEFDHCALVLTFRHSAHGFLSEYTTMYGVGVKTPQVGKSYMRKNASAPSEIILAL
jgi:hypothetical protein